FNKMTASEFESDWKQRNTDQKLDFIHMIQMLYYVTDPEATVSIFRSLLNKDGKLLIILVSGQSGWGRLWRTYQAQLCTSDISQCVMTGDVRNFLSIKGIPYQSHTLPSQMDITECFTAGDEKGELLLDFLTRSSKKKHREGLQEYFSLFECRVVQALVNDILHDYFNRFVFVYLDDILIFSCSLEEHVHHVQLVLRCLLLTRLYVKAKKYEFHTSSTSFLGFILSACSKQMDHSWVEVLRDWPRPKKLVPTYQEMSKYKLRKKFKRINEGISQHGTSAILNEIYTELYITEGWSGDINNEHEVRQIETVSRRPATQDIPIKCNDLIKDKSIRTVLTKAVAGIGKTVKKFILDWAEGKANQDIFMFPLPFMG
ncbi:hypothetical protein QTP70_009308, partial [Hemibagrus guttatus]